MVLLLADRHAGTDAQARQATLQTAGLWQHRYQEAAKKLKELEARLQGDWQAESSPRVAELEAELAKQKVPPPSAPPSASPRAPPR